MLIKDLRPSGCEKCFQKAGMCIIICRAEKDVWGLQGFPEGIILLNWG